MTVAELINEMKRLPQDMEVVVQDSYYDNCYIIGTNICETKHLDEEGMETKRVVIINWREF